MKLKKEHKKGKEINKTYKNLRKLNLIYFFNILTT